MYSITGNRNPSFKMPGSTIETNSQKMTKDTSEFKNGSITGTIINWVLELFLVGYKTLHFLKVFSKISKL